MAYDGPTLTDSGNIYQPQSTALVVESVAAFVNVYAYGTVLATLAVAAETYMIVYDK